MSSFLEDEPMSLMTDGKEGDNVADIIQINPFRTTEKKNRENEKRVKEERRKKNEQILRGMGRRKK